MVHPQQCEKQPFTKTTHAGGHTLRLWCKGQPWVSGKCFCETDCLGSKGDVATATEIPSPTTGLLKKVHLTQFVLLPLVMPRNTNTRRPGGWPVRAMENGLHVFSFSSPLVPSTRVEIKHFEGLRTFKTSHHLEVTAACAVHINKNPL